MPNRNKTKEGYKWSDQYLSDFLDTTTINGVYHVFRGRSNLRRVIWSILFVVSVIGCIALIVLSTRMLIERPTATTISIVSSEENGLAFPAVTVCNLNIRQNLSDMMSNESYQLLNLLFDPRIKFQSHSQGRNLSSVISDCQNIVDDTAEITQEAVIWNGMTSPDSLIYYCGLSLEPDSTEVISCTDDFIPVLTPAGICYTFNGIQTGQPDKIVRITGANYGLKLILNIDQENHPSTDGTIGAKVIVHERDDIPRPNLYGTNVSPGQNLEIGIRKYSIQDESKRNCIDGHPLEFFPGFQYSQFACRENALLQHFANNDTCGCIFDPRGPISGPYANVRNCTFSDVCCLVHEYTTFDQTTSCPLPCEFEAYRHENSYSSFPNGQFLNELAESMNMSTEAIKNNFLSVHVFVDDLEVISSVTKISYGAVDLLGDIGGHVGLFLGISVISMFEVLVLLVDELKKLCYTEECKKKFEDCDKNIPFLDVDASNTTQDNPDDGIKVSQSKSFNEFNINGITEPTEGAPALV